MKHQTLKSLLLMLCFITINNSFAQRIIVDEHSYLLYKQVINKSLYQNKLNSIAPSNHHFVASKGISFVNQVTLDQLPDAITNDDFFAHSDDKVKLGKLLFFDKILSGNMNNSCASCHHPVAGTGDGLSLPIGEGGDGIGITRSTGFMENAVHERVPRNAPHVFNLGAKTSNVMFHDGRVKTDENQISGFLSPAGDDLPAGLDNALAVQAMFPITSSTEMAGQLGENSVADATLSGNLAGKNGVWEQLTNRVTAIEAYVDLFKVAFKNVDTAEDITMVHIANAMAAFEAVAWRADNSAFDQYLRGDKGALSPNQIQGMNLFYGDAGCSQCHNGKFLASNEFKSIGMPQIGPGKGDNLPGFMDGLDDFGLERVTGNSDDRFKFRVPTVRNALLTGPWGHAGAYNDLRSVIKHHLNPAIALENYDSSQAIMPYRRDLSSLDFAVMNDEYSRNALLSNLDIENRELTESQIDRLMDFLDAVTDRSSIDLRTDFPLTVPSGLPVFD